MRERRPLPLPTHQSRFSIITAHHRHRASLRQPLATSTYEAITCVIVHESGSLHIGIDDRTAHEAKASLLEILRERITFQTRGRNLGPACPPIDFRLPANEAPHIAVE